MTPSIAEIIWIAGLIAWAVIRYPYTRRSRRHRIVGSVERTRQQSLVALSMVGVGIVPALYALFGFPKGADLPFSPVVAWIGVLAVLAYLFSFYRSHRDLGHNWSATLEIREKHALVTSGIYHYVRHPMYVSFWLMAVAQALLLQNWFVGLAGLVGIGILYFLRVKKEEKLMQDTFGLAYRDYAKRTARLIPKIY
ncbi:protein-S-isoprenylcysteine O-methyltransferase [Kaistia dalseonensis]|uniref:Protein-S-isoprenylcysteine O-methyltransferase Ste14 n=1 Tax=Kaistia dalseonensis TaxID=410840 RepID=A0ABU0H696_9HYPH|nr:protein-S-isoprenylcysteine O-methyltransferase [Kaistia dalseonensis]MCX5495243.1 protein-S-isoprenylcysteine O-methyltransferase [Kaistia dalseonensis]MDQ0437829.1 protein-S-isoprenylcysteine O-methyltransferase Ste14 [Kaistia dalseonensis]